MLGGLGFLDVIYLLLRAVPIVLLGWFVKTLSSMARWLGQIADRVVRLESAVRECGSRGGRSVSVYGAEDGHGNRVAPGMRIPEAPPMTARIAGFLAVTLAVACCARASARASAPAAADCGAVTAEPLRLDSVIVATMPGEYRLVQVTTSYDTRAYPRNESRLTLRLPDSTERRDAAVRKLGHSPRFNLQLLGTWRPRGDSGRAYAAEVDGGVLFLGCRDCLDASPDVLVIRELSGVGFRGSWRDYQTGMARVVDQRGRLLPDPAGYFCAYRIAPAP